ncbi:MAG: hypothetical protein JAZ05_07775, partial [Candidatus Thiodiazotropha taylori]|nr:hypothetical protein [Candidatus Thiodiazotropha taylori]MCW4291912.1 hypothetical protein [Candidatus Thiodiazotropha taylori]
RDERQLTPFDGSISLRLTSPESPLIQTHFSRTSVATAECLFDRIRSAETLALLSVWSQYPGVSGPWLTRW